MAAPQQPRAITKMTALGLKSDLKMHRAYGVSRRVRIEARHEWVETSFGKLIFDASKQAAMGLEALHDSRKTKPLRAHQQDVAHPAGAARQRCEEVPERYSLARVRYAAQPRRALACCAPFRRGEDCDGRLRRDEQSDDSLRQGTRSESNREALMQNHGHQ